MEGATDIIYDTLRATGLNWDEGPDVGGPVGPYIQSQRMGIFRQYAEQLVAEGKAYYCFCDAQRLEELHAARRPPARSATTTATAATFRRRKLRPSWTPACPTSSARRSPRGRDRL